MITCLQSTTETSSSLMLWLILTLSYQLRISGRESSLIWWFKGRVPVWIAKQEGNHTRIRSKGHREDTVQSSPQPPAIQSSPFLHAGSTGEFPAAAGPPFTSGGTASFQHTHTHTQQWTEETHRWKEVNADKAARGSGDRFHGARVHRDDRLAQSSFWLKVFSDQRGECFENVGLKTVWASFHQAFLYVLYFHLSETHWRWVCKFSCSQTLKCRACTTNINYNIVTSVILLTCKLMRIFFSSSSALDSCLTSCLKCTKHEQVSGAVPTQAIVGSLCFCDAPVLALQQLHRGPQVSQLVLELFQRRGGKRRVPHLRGWCPTWGGRRGDRAVARVWQGKHRGFGG